MFAAIALLLAVVAYRILSGFYGSGDFSWLHNFAPISAIALCGAAYLPRRLAIALPLLMLLASDLVLNAFVYHQPFFTLDILPRYLGLILISMLGFAVGGRAGLGRLLIASVAASLIFYVVTNTGSWLYEPAYAKTAAGWLQALGAGLPGYPPTWSFYRYTLLSDLFFTALFVACVAAAKPPTARAEQAQAPVAA